jgi:molecular chaperone DnaK
MGNIVGIHFGFKNAIAAFPFINFEIVTAYDNIPPDYKLTPSVVGLKGGKLIVGQEALHQQKSDPENTIFGISRLLGKGFGDFEVQQQLSYFPYKITESTKGTENSLSIWLSGQEYEPEDIAAEIIKKLVQNADIYQEQQGQRDKITRALITVPAYFNDKQRHAMQKAATRAGLAGSELLPEPTAAAISYGFRPDSDDVKTILVYDFGASTFDASIVTAAGNQFIESGKAGDLWLGGDDINDVLIDYVKQRVAEQEELDDIDGLIAKMPHYQGVRFMGDLKDCIEQAKIALSNDTSTRVIPSTPLLDDLGMAIQIDVEITREQFESMVLHMVERSISVCKEAIRYSDYPEEMIDVVLLVGGSSQIPLVQRKVKEAFGADKVVVHPRPMYAVVEGAAIASAGMVEKVGTVSRDYCIELVGDPRYRLIKQGDILPVKTTHTFKTEADEQSFIHYKLFSPDNISNRNDERIGDIWIAFDKTYPKGTEILLTVELDEKNGSLQITAILKNDPSVKVSCSLSTGGQDETISREVEETIQELNRDNNLTPINVQKAHILAGETICAASQIRSQDGKIREDRASAAKAKLQELKTFISESSQSNEKQKSMNKQSPTPNPYDVLEVSPGASNTEITKAFEMAMRHRKYPPDAIALARKSLMNPEERIIADYLRPIIGTVKRFKRSDFSALDRPVPKLEFLAEFDGLDNAIADSNKVSESDRRLGAILFTDSPIQTKITQDNSFAENSTEYSHSFVKKNSQ